MQAMDEYTLRKRRDRLFNPTAAPYEQLFGAMFVYQPPPPLAVQPMIVATAVAMPPSFPQPNFQPATPVNTEDPGPSMSTEQEPYATPQATSETQSPSQKSREERLSGRLERRGIYAGRIHPIIMQGMSPSNLVSGIRSSVYRSRVRIEPDEAA